MITNETEEVKEALAGIPVPLTLENLVEATGLEPARVRLALYRLASSGEVNTSLGSEGEAEYSLKV